MNYTPNNKKPHFLESIFDASRISASEMETIISEYQKVDFKKGAYLLKQGEVEKKYWFLESGFLRSYVIDTEGNEITFNLYQAGDVIIDYPSMFFFAPTKENIHAITDCVCWEISFERFQAMFNEITSYREHQRALLVGSYFALKEHSISLITDQAKDRYLKFIQQKPLIVQNVSLKYIATFLGITDTSLSRIRKEIAQS